LHRSASPGGRWQEAGKISNSIQIEKVSHHTAGDKRTSQATLITKALDTNALLKDVFDRVNDKASLMTAKLTDHDMQEMILTEVNRTLLAKAIPNTDQRHAAATIL